MYAAIVVPAVTESPVEKLPFVIVKTPFEIAALAPEALVTTVLAVTGVILVVLPPVTTVFFVTTVGVFAVQAVISSAEIAVPALADPTSPVSKPVAAVTLASIVSFNTFAVINLLLVAVPVVASD